MHIVVAVVETLPTAGGSDSGVSRSLSRVLTPPATVGVAVAFSWLVGRH